MRRDYYQITVRVRFGRARGRIWHTVQYSSRRLTDMYVARISLRTAAYAMLLLFV